MSRLRRLIQIAVTASILTLLPAMPAWARTAITGIGLHVDTELEVGETLPDLSIGNAEDRNYVYTTSSKYYIADVAWSTSTSKRMTIGETPRLKVYLETVDDDYYFRSSYSSSKATIKGADFVDAHTSGGQLVVTLKARPVKGQFDSPADAYWTGRRGQARWEAPDDRDMRTGVYDVYLYRGGSIVKKLENYRGTSVDFYPYMTKRGTYIFRVRTVPSNSKEEEYGKKSEWTVSDDLYIEADEVSDGTGQNMEDGMTNSGGITNVGWQQINGVWYFRYPDGSYQKNGWLQVDGRWYLFDSDGRMLKGWQQVNNIWYYLNPNVGGPEGAMQVGWLKEGNAWYYLNPNVGGPEGAMCANSWIQIGEKTYFVNSSGVMAEGWNKVGDQWYYFYPGSGEKAVNTVIDGFIVDSQGVWNRDSMTAKQ